MTKNKSPLIRNTQPCCCGWLFKGLHCCYRGSPLPPLPSQSSSSWCFLCIQIVITIISAYDDWPGLCSFLDFNHYHCHYRHLHHYQCHEIIISAFKEIIINPPYFSLRRGTWTLCPSDHVALLPPHHCLPPPLPLLCNQGCSGTWIGLPKFVFLSINMYLSLKPLRLWGSQNGWNPRYGDTMLPW